eukprot:scaffold205736_cov32-Tisochrysis_lutea.AAC.5
MVWEGDEKPKRRIQEHRSIRQQRVQELTDCKKPIDASGASYSADPESSGGVGPKYSESHNKPAGSLTGCSRIVERPALAHATVARQHQPRRGTDAPEQLIAQCKALASHHRCSCLEVPLLAHLSAQARVVKERRKCGAALEREQLGGISGCVLERLVARGERPTQARAHAALGRLERAVRERLIDKQHVARLAHRR